MTINLHPTRCNLCSGEVVLVDNREIYGRPYGSGRAYKCLGCGAYVGTHNGSRDVAMGILADARMRKGKVLCHAIFDRHWRTRSQRLEAYRRLASEMRIPVEDCHFGHFDLGQLRRAYRIIKKWGTE